MYKSSLRLNSYRWYVVACVDATQLAIALDYFEVHGFEIVSIPTNGNPTPLLLTVKALVTTQNKLFLEEYENAEQRKADAESAKKQKAVGPGSIEPLGQEVFSVGADDDEQESAGDRHAIESNDTAGKRLRRPTGAYHKVQKT